MNSLSAPAFATPLAPLAARTSFHGTVAKTSRRAPIAVRPVTRAVLSDTKPSRFNRAAEDRRAKLESEYRGPQGFTPYAEKVNGRLAQLGFVIGLITEIVSGKSVGEQILYMFSPLTNLAHSLVVLASTANFHHISL